MVEASHETEQGTEPGSAGAEFGSSVIGAAGRERAEDGWEPERGTFEGFWQILGAEVTHGFPGEVRIGLGSGVGLELDFTERPHFEVTVWAFEGETDDGISEGVGVCGLGGGERIDLEFVVKAGLVWELSGVEAEEVVRNRDFVIVLVTGDVAEVVKHENQQTRVSVWLR